ncbi:MAG: hypothetical protein CVV56_05870 [Tenericutes bacterium HGW-Tenericutes-1]|jgi:hypothetical protein|nr:MAG: hypothetical protein CVV56_05870 [Tenericutes bacterium HGW-Tenericutes-1]
MKKILLIIFIFIFSFTLVACSNEPIDMPIKDAFELMNEAIQNYLDAESLELEYHGEYASTAHLMRDDLRIRIKKIGSDSQVGQINVDMIIDDVPSSVITNYQKGIVYNNNINENSQSTKTFETQTQADFVKLYTMFLKSQINFSNVQEVLFQGSSKEITLSFLLSSTVVESTLYVLPAMDYAKSASVSITFTEKAKLLSMSVAYEASVDSVYGDFSYSVNFVKIDSYVIVPTLSVSEIALYKEVEENEE